MNEPSLHEPVKKREEQKNIYFVSDAHLGMPDYTRSLVREKMLVQWLEDVRHNAEAIYLVGDIFDFWFEWKHVVPQGFVRLLGKITEITDSGVPVYFFTGNHDVWVHDYLPRETGVQVIHEAIEIQCGGKKIYIAHGDGLGPGQYFYKLMKKTFRSKLFKWVAGRFHPHFLLWAARTWSGYGGNEQQKIGSFLGPEKEFVLQHVTEVQQHTHFDFYIFGHRHIALKYTHAGSTVIFLGDWLAQFTYAVFDGSDISLCNYTQS